MLLNSILLDAATGGAGNPAGTGWESFIMIIVLIAIFYFFMIRPQSKKQKQIKKFREGLSVGDKVITAGGIYGKIRDIKETTFLLEISDNVKIRIDKNSVYPSAEDAQTDAAAADKK